MALGGYGHSYSSGEKTFICEGKDRCYMDEPLILGFLTCKIRSEDAIYHETHHRRSIIVMA